MNVDLSVNNILPIFNSELILTYCKVDQRFQIAAQYLKHWAKKADIIGGSRNFLSAYALTIMVIAFM